MMRRQRFMRKIAYEIWEKEGRLARIMRGDWRV